MRTKNVINLLLAGALTVGFAACNNDDDVPNEKAGVTAMQFKVSEAQTRANEGQNDAEGVGAESKVTQGVFLTASSPNIEFSTMTRTTFTPSSGSSEESNSWTSEVVKYTGTTGNQVAALVLNEPASVGAITDPLQVVEIGSLGDLTKKGASETEGGFTMSTITKNDVVIKPNVAKADVGEGNNLLSFTAERVVSKVQFSMEGTTPTVGDAIKGDFKDLRYAVAGSAKKVYLFKDKAGERTLGTDNKYKDFKSAIHGDAVTTFQTENGIVKATKPRKNITKVSEGGLVAPFSTGFTKQSLPLDASVADYTKSREAGIFFLENSVPLNVTGKGQLKYNDITYVKVYATYAPTTVKKYDANTNSWSDVAPTTGGTPYKVKVTNGWKEAHSELEYEGSTDNWELKITDEAGTFYRGIDGKLYYDLISARAANNTTSEKFNKGKMVWMTPANNQIEGSGDTAYTKYADTRRNNIYSLSLSKIDGLGKNYDPIDPTDPNIEQPEDNPDEPDKDDVIDVDPTETHIQVKATILKWNLVHRGVVLK